MKEKISFQGHEVVKKPEQKIISSLFGKPIKQKRKRILKKHKNSLPEEYSTKLTWIFFLCLMDFEPSGRKFHQQGFRFFQILNKLSVKTEYRLKSICESTKRNTPNIQTKIFRQICIVFHIKKSMG
ncbi:hypothetical protein [Porphyromonas macacae]|uniref:hypothetical protein n=1 Tax=Porphyromonas macacae TaxID=28115 RepID=UPI0013575394|nr:hypothetical protein [Porphyromonas macacae]